MLISSAKYPDSKDPPPKNLLRFLPQPSLSTANLLTHTVCILYQAVKLNPQMLRPLSWPVYSNGYNLCLAHRIHQCPVCAPYLMSCYWWKLTSHIPLTMELLTDGAQLITWTAGRSVHDPSSHRHQTLFVTGNSISFTDVTPGPPINSNNHILQKISNTQSCNTTDYKIFTYPTTASERMDTHDVILIVC